jgi:hypothetical protein
VPLVQTDPLLNLHGGQELATATTIQNDNAVDSRQGLLWTPGGSLERHQGAAGEAITPLMDRPNETPYQHDTSLVMPVTNAPVAHDHHTHTDNHEDPHVPAQRPAPRR